MNLIKYIITPFDSFRWKHNQILICIVIKRTLISEVLLEHFDSFYTVLLAQINL